MHMVNTRHKGRLWTTKLLKTCGVAAVVSSAMIKKGFAAQ
jgi:hypothetical protein